MYRPFNKYRTSTIEEIIIIDTAQENRDLRKLNKKLSRKSKIQSVTVVGLIIFIVLVTRKNVVEVTETLNVKP